MSAGLGEVRGQSPVELARLMAERSAIAQDEAHAAHRRAAATQQTTVSPIDPAAEQMRSRALRELYAGAGEAVRYGQAREVLFRNPDGSTNLTERPGPDGPVMSCTTVHTDTPVTVSECEIWDDAREARWQARQRAAENVALAGRYDLAELVEHGVLTAEESRHPEVAAAAARRLRDQPDPANLAPYPLENSVG